MVEIIGIIIIALIMGVFITNLIEPPKDLKVKIIKKCTKKPHLDCPLVIVKNPRGGFTSYGHSQCCKIVDQYKAMNKLGALMQPGDECGEIKMSKSFHEQCVKTYAKTQALYSDGPLTEPEAERNK